ncbi:uncharacterized protein BO97DRAFT_416425 [Aspergillus homomorphus CBS 101889]|uniref:Uncharacterized protein n=1 Tax=Aspergillus homomorphus (strain CBS 101889) TaxID=1450537 RepID=A0A395HPT7_ASPHC|nr:hypothetical protein BO97DRAFT_416425 [Aspergillus homomorphus CBS 101889]RAL09951.1 hypothetical protein BO97DRAFT_416425 [Aspergillus homomorphus CBS 101889]
MAEELLLPATSPAMHVLKSHPMLSRKACERSLHLGGYHLQAHLRTLRLCPIRSGFSIAPSTRLHAFAVEEPRETGRRNLVGHMEKWFFSHYVRNMKKHAREIDRVHQAPGLKQAGISRGDGRLNPRPARCFAAPEKAPSVMGKTSAQMINPGRQKFLSYCTYFTNKPFPRSTRSNLAARQGQRADPPSWPVGIQSWAAKRGSEPQRDDSQAGEWSVAPGTVWSWLHFNFEGALVGLEGQGTTWHDFLLKFYPIAGNAIILRPRTESRLKPAHLTAQPKNPQAQKIEPKRETDKVERSN